MSDSGVTSAPDRVAAGYAACERMTRDAAANFALGIRLLPADRRRALSAVYWFANLADDTVDEASDPEAGRAMDAFLSRGARYSVAGDGVVVIGAEARARLDLRRAGGWLRRWWDERRTRAELEALSDHALRDIGLRRDEICSLFRR